MPRLWLLITAILTGIPSRAQVTSSWLVIWKQPSPSIPQTIESGPADLGAHRGRHAVAHGAEAAGVEPAAGQLPGQEVRGPHLVLADPGRVVGVRAGDLADPLDHVLRRQAAVGGQVVAGRIAPLEIDQVARPVADVGSAGRPAAAA